MNIKKVSSTENARREAQRALDVAKRRKYISTKSRWPMFSPPPISMDLIELAQKKDAE
jgi:hypothetical protein